MDRDHASLLPRVLQSLFPDEALREQAAAILGSYGPEGHHQEIDRVQLGILRLSGSDLAALERWTQLARRDYRDLLVEAEYRHSFGKQRLRERDSLRYQALQEQEREEYDAWLAEVLGNEARR